MPDIATIGALGSSIKTAIDIGKAVIAAQGSLDTAELRLKLADMITALASAKIELTEVQDALRAKDEQIAELQDALRNRDEVVKNWDAYYKKNADGAAIGHPFCMVCWERDHKLHHLLMHRSGGNACITCKGVFDGQRSRHLGEDASG
jgi:hypothetical protein